MAATAAMRIEGRAVTEASRFDMDLQGELSRKTVGNTALSFVMRVGLTRDGRPWLTRWQPYAKPHRAVTGIMDYPDLPGCGIRQQHEKSRSFPRHRKIYATNPKEKLFPRSFSPRPVPPNRMADPPNTTGHR